MNIEYGVNNTPIARVDKIVDLGIVFTVKMSINAHVTYIVSEALSLLRLVKRFSKGFNDLAVSKTLYCALIRSRLEYAPAVWSPFHATYQQKLESVHKKFLMFALPCQRDPRTYRLPAYID